VDVMTDEESLLRHNIREEIVYCYLIKIFNVIVIPSPNAVVPGSPVVEEVFQKSPEPDVSI
jgi:hypothetical protein